MVDVMQLKYTVNRMAVSEVREAVDELLLEGLVTDGKTPFTRVHFNTCLAEIEALFQRATTGRWTWWAIRGWCMHCSTRPAGSRWRCCAG